MWMNDRNDTESVEFKKKQKSSSWHWHENTDISLTRSPFLACYVKTSSAIQGLSFFWLKNLLTLNCELKFNRNDSCNALKLPLHRYTYQIFHTIVANLACGSALDAQRLLRIFYQLWFSLQYSFLTLVSRRFSAGKINSLKQSSFRLKKKKRFPWSFEWRIYIFWKACLEVRIRNVHLTYTTLLTTGIPPFVV